MGLLDFLGKRSADGLTIDETLMALSKGAVLIDVRTQVEFEAGHAPPARPVNPAELDADPILAIHGDNPLADHDSAIVVMCDTGLRSSFVASRLREKGFLAESVGGGLRAWAKDGNPVLPGPYRGRR